MSCAVRPALSDPILSLASLADKRLGEKEGGPSDKCRNHCFLRRRWGKENVSSFFFPPLLVAGETRKVFFAEKRWAQSQKGKEKAA
jgi:hypothetical protein